MSHRRAMAILGFVPFALVAGCAVTDTLVRTETVVCPVEAPQLTDCPEPVEGEAIETRIMGADFRAECYKAHVQVWRDTWADCAQVFDSVDVSP